MAKQQTFNEKARKKAGSEFTSVKVVMVDKTERGTYKFNERFVKVKDLADVEKVARG